MSIGQGNISFTDPSNSTGGGGSVAWTAITGKPSTIQFMFVVGGPNNFASIVGAPAVPVSGAGDMVTGLLSTFAVRMSRNGAWQMGLNPLDGNSYYTKVQSSNTIAFFPALAPGEEIIIETIPL
jgi:hypothetical protein